MWGKVSFLRKQHNGKKVRALNHQPSDLKSNMLTTTSPCPHLPFIRDLVKLLIKNRGASECVIYHPN